MATYFGVCNADGTILSGGIADTQGGPRIINNNASFACPGSGNQNIQDLSAYCAQSSPVNIRLGVYSVGEVLIAEGISEVAVGASLAWQGHMTQASVKAAGGSSPGILVGGTSYKLAAGWDVGGDILTLYYKDLGLGGFDLENVDYTGGMPANLNGVYDQAREFYFRCGVDPAGAYQPPGGGPVDDRFRFRPSMLY